MIEILKALLLGIVAGVIDVIPMVIKKMDKTANLSAFFHWVVLGLIIPFVNWPVNPALKGFIIAELSAIPILFIIASKDKKAIIPITIMSAILGMLIGFVGSKIIN